MRGKNEPFFVASVCLGCEFDDGMKWDLDIGQVGLWEVVEVGVSGVIEDSVRNDGERNGG